MSVGIEAAPATMLSAAIGTGGVDAAFVAVFAVFVVAFVVLAVVTIRWAVKRDRAGRAEWLARQASADAAAGDPGRATAHRRTGARSTRGDRRGSGTGARHPG